MDISDLELSQLQLPDYLSVLKVSVLEYKNKKKKL
jgi:hypothetical protein